jgi:hypothetical protein
MKRNFASCAGQRRPSVFGPTAQRAAIAASPAREADAVPSKRSGTPPARGPRSAPVHRRRERVVLHVGLALPLGVSLPHHSPCCAMNDKHAIRVLYIGWSFGFLMLVLAVSSKHPYGFYALLRWIACVVFAYTALVAGRSKSPAWAWLFAVEAIPFNPLAPIHLSRNTWQIIDWLSLASVAAAAGAFSKHLRTPQPPL